jgi:hypothetical protein
MTRGTPTKANPSSTSPAEASRCAADTRVLSRCWRNSTRCIATGATSANVAATEHAAHQLVEPVEALLKRHALCDKYDLPYTTGSLGRQYWQSFATIAKLALPDKLLRATADDAPETHSELKFRVREGVRESFGQDPTTGKRRGLRTALREMTSGELITA